MSDHGCTGCRSTSTRRSPSATRRRLLASGDRERMLACSALDMDWMDEIDPAHGVVISAQGLLMYLEPEQAHELIVSCARRFPGATLLCDVVPVWFSARTIAGMRSPAGYRPPPMPWGVDAAERARTWRRCPASVRFASWRLPGVAALCSASSCRCSAPTSSGHCAT
jgi:hypothetical protein